MRTGRRTNLAVAAKPAVIPPACRKDLRALPKPVRDSFGQAIYAAQRGGKAPNARPMKGYRGAGVLEVVEDHHGETYRAVYTVRFARAVYVLHVFEKKSKQGTDTPRQDLELIEDRLREAAAHYREHFEAGG